nr:hypothetical protein StreXyl84_75150 [Streptomyces sp. Xyl84]
MWVRHFVGYGGDWYFKDWHAQRQYTTGLLLPSRCARAARPRGIEPLAPEPVAYFERGQTHPGRISGHRGDRTAR